MSDRISPSRQGGSIETDLTGLHLSIQAFLDAVPAGAVAVDVAGKIAGLNAELTRQFGYDAQELIGHSIEMLVPTGLRASHALTRSRLEDDTLARTMGAGRQLNGRRKDGSEFPIEVGLRSMNAGRKRLILAIVSDRSDQARARAAEARTQVLGLELAHQEVIAREMGHRVKNLMATVTALVSLSARGAETASQMEESLRGRIVALASVIDLAFQSNLDLPTASTLTIKGILDAVLMPFMWTPQEKERIHFSGPVHRIGQRPAEVLALVFHELATNATKYGALKRPDGQIAVDWRRVEDRLDLVWTERMPGFVAATSGEEGFGTRLLSRLVEVELAGAVQRDVTTTGWTISISVPLASIAP